MAFDPDKYYLGTLCKYGHDYEGTGKSLRSTKNWVCMACRKQYGEKYCQNPEVKKRAKEYQKEYRLRPYAREKDRARQRSAESKKKRKEREEDPENKKRLQEKRREYYQRPEVKARYRVNARKTYHTAKHKEWENQYYKKPEVKKKRTSYAKKCVKDLSGRYVKQLIKRQLGLCNSEITAGLIKFKQEQLKLYRNLKNFKEEIRHGIITTGDQ